MGKPLLTIAIAMYNVEGYIAQCLDSCLKQDGVSYEDYEILVINDGSTDSSLDIVNDYALRFNIIRVVSQPNGGVASARNTAFKEAAGEYFWFVDSDDIIESNSVRTIIDNFTDSRCDCYIYNYREFDGNNYGEPTHFPRYEKPLPGKAIHNELGRSLPILLWITVYKKSFLDENRLLFIDGIIHEDYEFSVRAHHLADSILLIDKCIYIYRVFRIGSIMNGVRGNKDKSFVSWLAILNSHREFFRKNNTRFSRGLIGQHSYVIIKMMYSFQLNDINTTTFNKIKRRLYYDMFIGGSLKRKLLAVAAYILPRNFVSLLFRIFI